MAPQEIKIVCGESNEINREKKTVFCPTSEKKCLLLISSEKNCTFKLAVEKSFIMKKTIAPPPPHIYQMVPLMSHFISFLTPSCSGSWPVPEQ